MSNFVRRERLIDAMAVRRASRSGDKSRVCGEHQNAVEDAQLASVLVVPALPQIPYTGHRVHAEQPHNSRSERGMYPFSGSVVRVVVKRLSQSEFGSKERQRRKAGVLVYFQS